MSITIQTRLHEGIYRSEGGGQTITHREWTTGPRNLIAAAEALIQRRAAAARDRGSIGAGVTWMEIDGERLNEGEAWDILALAQWDEAERRRKSREYGRRPTRTEAARALLASVQGRAQAVTHG